MRTARGFTLIEIILSMVLLSMVGLVFVAAMTYATQTYLFAVDMVEITQKSRLALTRAFIELQEMNGPDDGNRANDDGNDFHFVDRNGNSMRLQRTGGQVLLNGNLLIDELGEYGSENLLNFSTETGGTWNPASDDFDELYEIEIRIILDADFADTDRTFVTTVNPLYTNVLRAPKME